MSSWRKKEAFEKYKENLLFIIKKEEDLNDPTLSRCRAALPGIPVLYDTFTENVNTLGRRMYVDPEKLPLLLLLKPGLLAFTEPAVTMLAA